MVKILIAINFIAFVTGAVTWTALQEAAHREVCEKNGGVYVSGITASVCYDKSLVLEVW
jgi:hypothetical protein